MLRWLATLTRWLRPRIADVVILPALALFGIIAVIVGALGGIIAIPLYFLEKAAYINDVFITLGIIGAVIWLMISVTTWWMLDVVDTAIDEKVDHEVDKLVKK